MKFHRLATVMLTKVYKRPLSFIIVLLLCSQKYWKFKIVPVLRSHWFDTSREVRWNVLCFTITLMQDPLECYVECCVVWVADSATRRSRRTGLQWRCSTCSSRECETSSTWCWPCRPSETLSATVCANSRPWSTVAPLTGFKWVARFFDSGVELLSCWGYANYSTVAPSTGFKWVAPCFDWHWVTEFLRVYKLLNNVVRCVGVSTMSDYKYTHS